MGVGSTSLRPARVRGDGQRSAPVQSTDADLQWRYTLAVASATVEPAAPMPAPIPGDSLALALAGLTDAQRLAVESPAAALCVLAGAGSGKTRVLTLRVARRIRDGSADADHTVVCTFTRKAAHELRDRLARYGVAVSVPAGPAGVPTPGVRAGTLHQLALTLLRRRAFDTGRPAPVLVEHRWRTLVELAGDRSLASTADTEIGWAKARCLTPDRYVEAAEAGGRHPALPLDRLADHFAAYQAALQRRRKTMLRGGIFPELLRILRSDRDSHRHFIALFLRRRFNALRKFLRR